MAFVVKRAQHAGACYGVQRALDMTNKAACEQPSVCTLGPLIHNPRVVSDLESRGITACNSIDDIAASSVVIRSHGVAPEVLSLLSEKGYTVIDATCPHVMRAQQAAAKMAQDGYHVLVVGEAGHPEVEGISAYARSKGGQCTIVDGAADIPKQLEGNIGVVVQTTQLFEFCQAHGRVAYHVEGPEEIDPSWFEGCSVVGVTAGASTPENQIDAVIAAIEQVAPQA